MDLNSDIGEIKYIGEKRRETLNKHGIFKIRDIIEYFPRDYMDRSVITPVGECLADYVYTIKGKICGEFEIMRINNLTITRVNFTDGMNEIRVVWFNQPYIRKSLKPDAPYILTGTVREWAGRIQMESPDFELGSEINTADQNKIIPVYRSIPGISQKVLRSVIKNTLSEISQFSEFLPKEIRGSLCERDFAIRNIHFPSDKQAFFIARKRLVFDDLLLAQLSLRSIKSEIKKQSGIIIKKFAEHEIQNLMQYNLTGAQKRVLFEIENDMLSGVIMNRLVQGDVGSGKTAVAAAAAYMAAMSGYQVAMMAPTEVLAAQHYSTFNKVFEQIGINTVLLSGSLKKREKTEIYRKISDGSARMVIGTHALIQEGVRFKNIALVITDEQHRFGVTQRTKLSDKGTDGGAVPHVLIMSATPIPRTLALILYGDLDVSTIDELPPGKKKINTYAVNSSYRTRIYNFIKKEIESGRQTYIICPMVEENEKFSNLKSVTKYAEEISEIFVGNSVACLHGKMKDALKRDIIEKFFNGETDILVATTVVEVGVNVPNASVMFIENAERFGLSQLHQLRGRVGRGAEKSYCILLTDSKSEITRKRMNAIVSNNDGFRISEMDLELRGPGDFFGTRQHGLPEFKIANLYKDMDILKVAQDTASLITNNGYLSNENYFQLNYQVNECFEKFKKISM